MSGSALSLSGYVIHRIVITSSMLIRFYWLDQAQIVAGWLSDLQIQWSDKRLDVVRCDMAKVGESEWVSVTLSELPAHPARPAAHPPPPSSHSLPDIISMLRGHLRTITDTWLDAARTCQYSRLYTDSDLSCITLGSWFNSLLHLHNYGLLVGITRTPRSLLLDP